MCGVSRGEALAERLHLPGMRVLQRLAPPDEALDFRMPRLRPADVRHGGDGDARLQGSSADVVPRRPSGGDALERHVGPPAASEAGTGLIQDRVAVAAQAPQGDGEP